eukprot:6492205-Amphidinium_carterae.1
MAELLFAQISEEVSFMVMWTSTLPYKLAQMLLPNPTLRADILKTVRDIYTAYAEAEAVGGKFWSKLLEMTNLHWVVNKELYLLLEETNWEWSKKLELHLTRMWSNMGSTLVTERAFQSIRDHEKFSSKRELSACSLWRKPSVDKVLGGRHAYAEVDSTVIPHHEVADLSLPYTFFQPALKSSSDTFADLPGRGQPDWERMSAAQIPQLGSNTNFLLYAHKQGVMHEASACWRSSLASPGMLMRSQSKNVWAFCIHSSWCTVYFWPARKTRVGKVTCFEMDCENQNVLWHEPVLRLGDWECMPTTVASPMELYIMNDHRETQKLPGLPVVQQGEPEPLLKWCARNAFKGVSKQLLKRLDSDEIGALSGESDLGDMIFVLIQAVLEISDADVLDIMRRRCLTPHFLERHEILASAEIEDITDQDGVKEARAIQNRENILEEGEQEVMKTIRRRLEHIKSGAPPTKRSKSSKRSWPADHDLTVSKAQDLLPPNAKLWADQRCSRFQVFFNGGSCSRSWQKWGYATALKQIVQWTWQKHTEISGQACTVEGLFA